MSTALLRIITVLAILMTESALAQRGATAQLSGMIVDADRAMILGAKIIAENKETGLTRVTYSTQAGYILTNLPPGVYQVVVEAQGFVRLLNQSVEITVGENATLNIMLQVAGVSEQITVTAGPEVIEPTRTEQSQVIDELRIENLPINGRRFLDFALLTPNVGTGRSNAGNQIRPGEPNEIDISFAGLYETASMLTVDGANNMNGIFRRPRSTPSQEAVREFRVIANGYAAEHGAAAGAIVNIVTKSGANQPHGSAYYYARRDAFDARNILAPPRFDKLSQNQFGGTLGGPLVRDRWFLFGNYEGQRRAESPFFSSVLLENLQAINEVRQSLRLRPEVLEGELHTTDYDTFMLRNDYRLSADNDLALVYRFRDEREKNTGASRGQISSAPSNFRNAFIRDHALVGNITSIISPGIVNQALFQFARRSFDFPSLTFEPHLTIPNTFDMGRQNFLADETGETSVEFGETLSKVAGGHVLKFGGGIHHTRHLLVADLTNPGFAIVPNLDAFLGRPTFLPFPCPSPCAVYFGFKIGPDGSRPPAAPGFASLPDAPSFVPLSRTTGNQTHYGVFAQDQWRATHKLTLNYGLRWDMDVLPSDVYKVYKKAFQPRVGIAHSLLSDRVVVRLGGGIYQGIADTSRYLFTRIAGQNPAFGLIRPNEYSAHPGTLLFPNISNPFIAAPAFLQFMRTGIYPRIEGPGLFPGQSFMATTNRENPRALYSYQWNLQVDYRLTGDMALSLGYLGVRGLNVNTINFWNVAPPLFKLPNGKNDYGIAPGVPIPRLINDQVSPLSGFFNHDGQSMHHGGTVTLNKRFAKQYAFTVNYTWSKTIDNFGSDAEGPEDIYRRDLERGLSKQHVPHRFVTNFVAEGPPQTWLRDFRFSLIANATSAAFYNIFAGVDVNNDGTPLSDRVGTAGRSTYKGDNLVNFDVRLSRQFRLADRAQMSLVAEAFNLFNTLNVTDINTVYGSGDFMGPIPRKFGEPAVAPLSSFGSIRAIAPPRQLQLALRLSF